MVHVPALTPTLSQQPPRSQSSCSTYYCSYHTDTSLDLAGKMMANGLSFQLQCGLNRESVTMDICESSLKQLRMEAVKFVTKHVSDLLTYWLVLLILPHTILIEYPHHGLGENLSEHILLYKHDFRSVNILQLLTTSDDVNEGTLIEIVISRELPLQLIRLC